MRKTTKLPPALKHGGYSSMALLPGESQADFEKLHRDLISELAPAGALEDDIVATMARLLWRKQNLKSFRIANEAKRRYQTIRYETGAVEPFRMSGFERPDPEKVKAAEQAAVEQARKELGPTYELVEIGEIATIDRMMEEIEVVERLDGMIERCIKRLLYLRGLKSLSPASQAAQPRRIPPPTKAA